MRRRSTGPPARMIVAADHRRSVTGFGMGIATWLTRPLKGIAQRMVTRRVASEGEAHCPT